VQALAPLGIADRVDYDGKDGPPGHPDLKGFGCRRPSRRIEYDWRGAAVTKARDTQADLPSIAVFPEPLARHPIRGFFFIPCRHDPCLLPIPAPM
jgi:hypothetical protein